MADRLVVGIYPDTDPKALESALAAQQLDLTKIKVVGGRADDDDETKLEFLDVINDMDSNSLSDDMTRGMGILPDSGGTSVPGLGGRQSTLGSFSSQAAAPQAYFSGFPIPSDEVDNFSDAVADGRAVVLYPDPGADAEKIAAAFKAAGLRNVRAY